MEQTLDLPPGYTLVALRELGDAFAHGCDIAAEAGAGTLVWVRRYDLVEFAVVLEPDEPLRSARRAFFAGMNAVADAIAAHCPPEREVSFDWPDTVRFDAGLLGGGRLGWPRDCTEDEVPAWLVFGVILRAADMAHVPEVQAASGVSLLSEGFEMVDTDAIIESFTRHLMTGLRSLERARVRGDRAGLSGTASQAQGRRAPRHRRQWRPSGQPARRPRTAGANQPCGCAGKRHWYDPQARGPKFG